MNKTVLLFDLDGTLLDTLDDLYLSVNHALLACGYPARTREEVRNFVGGGVKKLIERAVPAGTPQDRADEVLRVFRPYYASHSLDHTAPYPGIMEALAALAAAGCQMAIVSNKFDEAVKALNRDFFGQYISTAIGESDRIPKKPAPDGIFEAIRTLGARTEDCIYIGDSEVDVLTARAAGIPCLGCAWGFRGRGVLRDSGLADSAIFDTPTDLTEYILSVTRFVG